MPYRERIDLAYEAWNDANRALSIRRAGEDYRVAYSTLNGRIKGEKSAVARQEEQQRLFPEEEAILVKWITQYKNHVYRITRLGTGYAIDKVDFLEMLRVARKDAITPTNI